MNKTTKEKITEVIHKERIRHQNPRSKYVTSDEVAEKLLKLIRRDIKKNCKQYIYEYGVPELYKSIMRLLK